jgi:hypothetical protein
MIDSDFFVEELGGSKAYIYESKSRAFSLLVSYSTIIGYKREVDEKFTISNEFYSVTTTKHKKKVLNRQIPHGQFVEGLTELLREFDKLHMLGYI